MSRLSLTTRSRIQQVLRYSGLTLAALISALPIVWMISSSLRPPLEMFAEAGRFGWGLIVPKTATFENYISLFVNSSYGRALGNSLFVSITSMVLGVLINAAAGFAFAAFDFRGRNLVFGFVLVTAMMPFEAIVIPLYLLVQSFGMVNTYQALIIPDLANGFVIFLFRQFFMALPKEFYEAARIDGASWFSIFFRLALPMSWPVVLTGATMIFIQQFEAFFWPMVVASSPEMTTVQVEIAKTMSLEGTSWGHLFSGLSIASLVALVPFIIFQRFYIQNSINAGLK